MAPMTFRNLGGSLQAVVDDADQLGVIDRLDAARWAATSAPLRDLHCDPAFLAFVDTDSKGRIRVAQLIRARDWLFRRLARHARLADRTDVLVLEDLDRSNDDGKRLAAAAEHLLREINAPDRTRLALADIRAFRSSYAKTLANGDGIVPPACVTEPPVAAFMQDVLGVVGGSRDASGEDGVGTAELDRFLERGAAYLSWKARAAAEPALLPWGEGTAAAAAAICGLDARVEEYFLHCDLLAAESVDGAASRLSADELKALRAGSGAAIERYLAESPLAPPQADGRLPLTGRVNPAFRARLMELAAVLSRALGADTTSITRDDWRRARAVFDGYQAWQRERPAEPFEKLSESALRAALDGPLPGRVRHFIAVDRAAAPEVEQLSELERLVLHQRWLLDLVNNFVNFSAIFDPERHALLEMGSLVIDGRRLEFCVRVEDRSAHKKVAAESLLFLVYASISDKDGTAPSYEIAAPVTAGERGRIRVGKRGIFVDLDGREWDATVVDLVENPISILEAMKAPFRRASQLVSRKIDELAAAQLAAAEKRALSTGAALPGLPAPAPAPPATPPPDVKPAAPGGFNGRDLLLGGSIAFAALGSAFAYAVSALSSINPLSAVAAVASLVAVVAGFAGFLGWLKLRRRDMSILLEANGWAVNVPLVVTRRIGALFTRIPPLPPGTVAAGAGRGAAGTPPVPWTSWALALLCLAGALAFAAYTWHVAHPPTEPDQPAAVDRP
ncbi:MAG: hypothetical protein HY904_23970 [Deltaproteobacteria bacterium]|nr:hypothetical protein [Deltaproteobacteria bacterium]